MEKAMICYCSMKKRDYGRACNCDSSYCMYVSICKDISTENDWNDIHPSVYSDYFHSDRIWRCYFQFSLWIFIMSTHKFLPNLQSCFQNQDNVYSWQNSIVEYWVGPGIARCGCSNFEKELWHFLPISSGFLFDVIW